MIFEEKQMNDIKQLQKEKTHTINKHNEIFFEINLKRNKKQNTDFYYSPLAK